MSQNPGYIHFDSAMPARRRQLQLLLSYAPDWIITFALAAIFFSLDKIHGFRRQFSVQDTSYVSAQHHPLTLTPDRPFKTSSYVRAFRFILLRSNDHRVLGMLSMSACQILVPLSCSFTVKTLIYTILALYLIAVVAPVVAQVLINAGFVRSWWDLHNSLLGRQSMLKFHIWYHVDVDVVVLALALSGSITQFTKLTVGRPRPDLLDRCQPTAGSVDPIYGLSNSTICTTPSDDYIMLDGFRSFPSGHATLSFAGLGFLAFYMAGKLHLFDQRGYAAKLWIFLTPFAGAALVAISRTMDYRHHWQDVLIGSILGTVVSYFTYRQYYPSLSSDVCHLPYAPRIAKEEPSTHHRPSNSFRRSNDEADVYQAGPLEGTVRRDAPRDGWRQDEDPSSLLPRREGIPMETV
ncbi:unnamed protein product [Mycena citricolor]|uniref:Phosphatidic acid phosphatase type 2/haloperoxidase domain-containing protein n=1 Tax=Mycena citricolor TaxID=2018698 RepID=A0AAD2HK85_9AGAR|nr:unnamed protein product [Mycena citricolor]